MNGQRIIITNRKLCSEDFLSRIEKIALAGPDGIILREKDLKEEEYQKLVVECKKVLSPYSIPLLINEHYQVAKECGIDNVQLSFRTFLQYVDEPFTFKKVGVSVHSTGEAIEAERLGADFLIAGHIFETSCKPGLPSRGTAFLKKICESVKIPVFGIGGIHVTNYLEVLHTGAKGICMMSEFMLCEIPENNLKKYV